MNENKLMKQVNAIFGIFMVIFYLGVGVYLIFFFKNDFGEKSDINKAAVGLIGGTFIFYGLYRAFSTYNKIVKLFFRHDDPDEQVT